MYHAAVLAFEPTDEQQLSLAQAQQCYDSICEAVSNHMNEISYLVTQSGQQDNELMYYFDVYRQMLTNFPGDSRRTLRLALACRESVVYESLRTLLVMALHAGAIAFKYFPDDENSGHGLRVDNPKAHFGLEGLNARLLKIQARIPASQKEIETALAKTA